MWFTSFFVFAVFFSLMIFIGFFVLGDLLFYLFSLPFLNFNFSFSSMSNLFFFSLMIIFLSIMIFCIYYISFFENFSYYLLMLIFCFSMIFLLFHNNLFSLMLGWDGLGISSYLLVLYYENWNSINSSFVTVLSNRLGDSVMMLFFMQQVFFFNSQLSMMLFPVCFLIFIIAGITKSAQFPFSSWLPQAMAAPTPTSALVHSSTLVTAGIYLFLKYYFLMKSFIFMKMFLILGTTTLYVSGFMSFLEMDSKKTIALSTLNQLGFMVLCLSLSSKMLVFFHLLTHAFFKSCMFLQMGFFIHNNFSSQDSRVFMLSGGKSFFSSLTFCFCIFSLCGLTFCSGYASKEIILFSFFYLNYKVFLFFSIFLLIVFTVFYSGRLLFSLIAGMNMEENQSYTFLMKLCSFFLLFFGLFFGQWMNKSMFIFCNLVGNKEVLLVFSIFLLFIILLNLIFLCFFSSMLFQDTFYKFFNFLMKKNKQILDTFSFYYFNKNIINFVFYFLNNFTLKISVYIIVFLLFFVLIF